MQFKALIARLDNEANAVQTIFWVEVRTPLIRGFTELNEHIRLLIRQYPFYLWGHFNPMITPERSSYSPVKQYYSLTLHLVDKPSLALYCHWQGICDESWILCDLCYDIL